jgi:hypothetical protein
MISQLVLSALLAEALPGGPSPVDATAGESPARADSSSLRQVLDSSSSDTSQARFATAVTQVVLGSALLGPGLALANRSDSELQFVGVGFIVGGSIQLGVAPLLLIPTPVERIRNHLRQRTAGGQDEATVADAIERELREAAERKRQSRPMVGWIGLAIGTGSLATGMTFLLARPGLAGMERQTQFVWGAALVGAGAPFVAAGLRSLLQRSPEEAAWEAYVTARGRNGPAASNVRLSSALIVPTARGAVGTLGFVF